MTDDRQTTPPGHEFDDSTDLEELRDRLNALQGSVERLGAKPLAAAARQAVAPPPVPYPPASSYEPPPVPYPPASSYEPPPVEHIPPPTYTTPAAAEPQQETYPLPQPYAPAAAEPQQETYPLPQPYAPAAEATDAGGAPDPTAADGLGEGSGLGITAMVAYVDVGPFASLVELHRFEVDLAALDAVRDVRVRRAGRGRAQVEVWMAGPYSLTREMQRLGVPMRAEAGPEGQIVIELNPAVGDQTVVRSD